MKIVRIKGGLGNQMFQYAFAKCLEYLTGEQIKIDMTYYRKYHQDLIRKPRILKFNLSLQTATDDDINEVYLLNYNLVNNIKLLTLFEAVLNKKYYFEFDRGYRNPRDLIKYSYFDGYWQSWQTVDLVWNKLRCDFVLKDNLCSQVLEFINILKSQNSVFIGVRRGDYLQNKKHWGEFKKDYFLKAMNYIAERIQYPVFYFFSNDIKWVKENLNFEHFDTVFHEVNNDIDDFDEMILMSNCKHSIITNSTYHWWAARLNYNKDKIVVAPKTWFFDGSKIDIIPSDWIRLN